MIVSFSFSQNLYLQAWQTFSAAWAPLPLTDPLKALLKGLSEESFGDHSLCGDLAALSKQIQGLADQLKALQAQLKADLDALKLQVAALQPTSFSTVHQRAQAPTGAGRR
jgi:hypothetical protein